MILFFVIVREIGCDIVLLSLRVFNLLVFIFFVFCCDVIYFLRVFVIGFFVWLEFIMFFFFIVLCRLFIFILLGFKKMDFDRIIYFILLFFEFVI